MASVHTGHGVHLLLFSLKPLHLMIPAPFVVLVLSTWTTLLRIFTSLSEILWGATGHGWFMVKLCSFLFQIMAPIVLTGTLFDPLYSDWNMQLICINSYLKLRFFPPPLMEAPSLISSNKRVAPQNCQFQTTEIMSPLISMEKQTPENICLLDLLNAGCFSKGTK